MFLGGWPESVVTGLGLFNLKLMQLPIEVNGRLLYMDSGQWESEQEWRRQKEFGDQWKNAFYYGKKK